MIKVTIELVPFGMLECATTLSEIYIANVGNADADLGLYQYSFEGYVEGFDNLPVPIVGTVYHAREELVTELVRKVLNNRQEVINASSLK